MSAQPVVYVVDDDPAVNRLLDRTGQGDRTECRGLRVCRGSSLKPIRRPGRDAWCSMSRVPGMSGMELQKH